MRKTLGPSVGWIVKDKVTGRVPLVLGHSAWQGAEAEGGKVCHICEPAWFDA